MVDKQYRKQILFVEKLFDLYLERIRTVVDENLNMQKKLKQTSLTN